VLSDTVVKTKLTLILVLTLILTVTLLKILNPTNLIVTVKWQNLPVFDEQAHKTIPTMPYLLLGVLTKR